MQVYQQLASLRTDQLSRHWRGVSPPYLPLLTFGFDIIVCKSPPPPPPMQNNIYLMFSLRSPAPSYRWARIHTNGSVVDIRKSKDVKFEDSHHTMIIHGIDKKHNGTYACISTIGTIQDRVEWKLTVRGIC